MQSVHQSFVLHSDSEADVFAFSAMTSSFSAMTSSYGTYLSACFKCGLGRPEFAIGHGNLSANVFLSAGAGSFAKNL